MSIALKEIQYIVVHHSGTPFSTQVSSLKDNCLHWLSKAAKQNLTSFGYVADYHLFIRSDGTVHLGQPTHYWCAHCGVDSINTHSLAICCVGNLSENSMPDKMLSSLTNEVRYWMKLFSIPIGKVLLHSSIVATDCPGKNFREVEFRRSLSLEEKLFTDVDPKRWSYKAIALVKAKGIMAGNPDGSFRPQEPITREELAQVIKNLFDKNILE